MSCHIVRKRRSSCISWMPRWLSLHCVNGTHTHKQTHIESQQKIRRRTIFESIKVHSLFRKAIDKWCILAFSIMVFVFTDVATKPPIQIGSSAFVETFIAWQNIWNELGQARSHLTFTRVFTAYDIFLSFFIPFFCDAYPYHSYFLSLFVFLCFVVFIGYQMVRHNPKRVHKK